MVEGKVFFYGDTKLGVNNIPADVVDKIEIIEDFHDTVFLKGLESSEDIAMNIKLKADKKKFVSPMQKGRRGNPHHFFFRSIIWIHF